MREINNKITLCITTFKPKRYHRSWNLGIATNTNKNYNNKIIHQMCRYNKLNTKYYYKSLILLYNYKIVGNDEDSKNTKILMHAKYIFKFKSNYAISKLIITFHEKIFSYKITFRRKLLWVWFIFMRGF